MNRSHLVWVMVMVAVNSGCGSYHFVEGARAVPGECWAFGAATGLAVGVGVGVTYGRIEQSGVQLNSANPGREDAGSVGFLGGLASGALAVVACLGYYGVKEAFKDIGNKTPNEHETGMDRP